MQTLERKKKPTEQSMGEPATCAAARRSGPAASAFPQQVEQSVCVSRGAWVQLKFKGRAIKACE